MLQDLCDVTHSINFPHSEDGSSTELHSSPARLKKNRDSYKCFRCYGQGRYSCSECGGTEKVQGNNPLAKLLDAVLTKKLNVRKQEKEREQMFEDVVAIKQQEQQMDQRRIICSYCQLECQYSVYSCPKCPWFQLCLRCESKHIYHEHSLTRNVSSLCGVQFQHSIKLCYSCNSKIQNCYSICRTCNDQGSTYWLCDHCSDNGNYTHNSKHVIQTVIDYDSFKDDRLQTVSQDFQGGRDQESIVIQGKQLGVMVEQEEGEREDEEQLEEEEIINEEYRESVEVVSSDCRMSFNINQIRITRKNSSIHKPIQMEDQSPIYKPSPFKGEEPISRVRFQIDGLFSSYDFSSQKISQQNILRPPLVATKEDRFSCTISQQSSNPKTANIFDQPQQPSYILSGYRCDICELEPIRDVRYHCQQCQDYDVCESCYQEVIIHHHHSPVAFERIDRKTIKEKMLERVGKQNRLKKSLNLNQRKGRSRTLRLNSGIN